MYNMYNVQYIDNDQRESRCQTGQSIDLTEVCRIALYILLSRKGVHCTFVEAEQVAPSMSFTKVARTYGGESLRALTLEPLDWDMIIPSARDDASHRIKCQSRPKKTNSLPSK